MNPFAEIPFVSSTTNTQDLCLNIKDLIYVQICHYIIMLSSKKISSCGFMAENYLMEFSNS